MNFFIFYFLNFFNLDFKFDHMKQFKDATGQNFMHIMNLYAMFGIELFGPGFGIGMKLNDYGRIMFQIVTVCSLYVCTGFMLLIVLYDMFEEFFIFD